MNTLNDKNNDWLDQFGGYIILAGIVAVIAGFGVSRILNSWGLTSLIPLGIGGGIIIGFATAKAIRNKWFSSEASKKKGARRYKCCDYVNLRCWYLCNCRVFE